MPSTVAQRLLQARHVSHRPELPCRTIAHRRYAVPRRSFHASARLKAPPNPSDGSRPLYDETKPKTASKEHNKPFSAAKADGPSPESLKYYGSARRRAMRNDRLRFREDTFSVFLPQNFLDNNVLLHAENSTEGLVRPVVSHIPVHAPSKDAPSWQGNTEEHHESSIHPQDISESRTERIRYEVAADVWNELDLAMKNGLKLPRPESKDALALEKCHMIINAICENGQYLVHNTVRQLAKKHQADLVTIDALDIASIATSHHHGDYTIKNLRNLGFEVYKESNEIMAEGPIFLDEPSTDNGDMEPEPLQASNNKEFRVNTTVALNLSDALRPLMDKWGLNKPKPNQNNDIFMTDMDEDERTFREQKATKLWNSLINQILRAPSAKSSQAQTDLEATEGAEPSKRLIIFVQDIMKIQENKNGEKFLENLLRVVEDKRRSGQSVMLVGSMSTRFDDYKQQIFDPSYDFENEGVWQLLVVPPLLRDTHARAVLYEDRKKWYRDVNERQLKDALRHRKPPHLSQILEEPVFVSTNSKDKHAALLAANLRVQDRYLSAGQITRMATFIAGNDETEVDKPFNSVELRSSLQQLLKSDAARNVWFHDERKIERERTPRLEPTQDDKTKRLQKSCTKHERKLLGGVIEAEKIRTTFTDVHAPIETIDALKTLTTLSLIRPDAFAYGVLASDKIPGLLLYGPPGTGKTLLAKAVAKESGAKVLEVSGAEINDMYVGESEKNIKALFTLAKKLTPCVIFIDEADAMFSSRTQSRQRTAHREMINQFLREWDGMSNDAGGAFIMVATNRPFDLDDAVLRRLPRRLLVDLPGEQDRREILKIHLKEESLAEDVDLHALASKTPFYSGSDLKNLVVAAALNCVREENEFAKQHTGDEPYAHPPKRTLHQRHFDTAMEEITASISDDMDTLKSIKKFDEQYGDRRGRKKKSPKWGFKTPAEADQVLDTIKVRQ